MAQETSSNAVASETQIHARASLTAQDVLSIARSRALGLWNKIKYLINCLCIFWCTVAWPFLHRNAVIPATIFAVAVFAKAQSFVISKKHSFMCTAHQFAARIARARAQRLTGVALLAGLVVFLFSTAFYSFGIEVIIDGESLGYVISQADYQESVMKVQNRVSKIMGEPHSVNPNVVFSFDIVERDKILEGERLESVLFSKIEGVEELYTLTVDGRLIGACTDRASVENALAALTATSDSNIKKEILSNVEISFDAVDTSDLCTSDELLARLRVYETTPTTHVIGSNETIGSICRAYDMTRSEFRMLNPSVDSLVAGEEIIVNKSEPLVSMKQFSRVTNNVSIPFETQEIKDSSMYVGKKSVKTNGVAGSKQVVYDVTYVDGKETERVLISETVTKQPTTKVVLVGTKPVPKKAATGTFRRPTGAATITSNYGYRRGGFHTGVDFALAYGSPVYASDGGTVSYAGWKGGYGYLVIINHGNGKQTYYAHNSKLLVSRGDKVGKGEQIAKIGSTGNSTGPHCHFEIRVNGKHINPWRYLS